MREDSGFFSCHAINSYGEDRGIIQLTVQGRQRARAGGTGCFRTVAHAQAHAPAWAPLAVKHLTPWEVGLSGSSMCRAPGYVRVQPQHGTKPLKALGHVTQQPVLSLLNFRTPPRNEKTSLTFDI